LKTKYNYNNHVAFYVRKCVKQIKHHKHYLKQQESSWRENEIVRQGLQVKRLQSGLVNAVRSDE
jgi:hypothetical protein